MHVFNTIDGSVIESIITDQPVCRLRAHNDGAKVAVVEADPPQEGGGQVFYIDIYTRVYTRRKEGYCSAVVKRMLEIKHHL